MSDLKKEKIIRITTIPNSLRGLLRGQLNFMSDYYDVIGISTAGQPLEDVKNNEGVRVISVTMTRTISPINDIKAVWQLYKIFRKEKPLIVHTHTPKAGTVGMIAAKLAGVKHRLHTIAGLPLLETTGKKRKLLDTVEKLTYKCATRVYPNSHGLYDIVIKNKYTTKNKLKVIGKGSSNGIDTTLFDPKNISKDEIKNLKEDLSISENDFVFVFVGRIVKDKGINELINAFKALNHQFGNTKLILVGSFEKHLDPLKPETEKEIEQNDSIISVGFQEDVKPYFAIADVLTFPSYREGFPNVVMQAGAMGLTSIVSDINGCNEIISNGLNGYIIPPKNEKALHEKMKYLFQNQDVNEQMASNARAVICENYERAFIWNEILKEYKEITS